MQRRIDYLDTLLERFGGVSPKLRTERRRLLSAIQALPRMVEIVMEECAICIQSMEISRLLCGHQYQIDCLLDWLKISGSCPQCREKLPKDDVDTGERLQRLQRNMQSLKIITNSGCGCVL